ncbi:MAG: hypothetical protein RL367_2297 [Pseudomonadota bacterium]
MALFPVIQSPCPYSGNLSAVMQGDMCSMCNRQVFELTSMSDSERVAFLKSCSGEVCVSYKLPLKRAMAAAALAAMAVPTALAAQEVPAAEENSPEIEDMIILVGGIKDPRTVAMRESAADLTLPELPVEVEAVDQPARSPTQ